MMHRHDWLLFCCSILTGNILSLYKFFDKKGVSNDMAKTSYPNQDMVTIHKERYDANFLQVGIDEWTTACVLRCVYIVSWRLFEPVTLTYEVVIFEFF